MMTQPPTPNVLGDSVMIFVMPAKAPSAIAVLQAGSVASSNLSSMGVLVRDRAWPKD
jgi:hypothetical protein